jgi:C1A family cysteine protease
MFGFTAQLDSALGDGVAIPFQEGDRVEEGHAVVAVGYDDGKKIGSSTGAS